MNSPINIAIFASGNGTNMQAITDYFTSRPASAITVSIVVSDNPEAYVLERSKKAGVPYEVLDKSERTDEQRMLGLMSSYRIKYIVLAGYLRKVPLFLIKAYEGRILNIHPALLPKFGGKGMYGHFVHEAVKTAGETKTGITIHEVNEAYDRGRIIFQAETQVDPSRDTPEVIAEKVHLLEQKHFPGEIERWIISKEKERSE